MLSNLLSVRRHIAARIFVSFFVLLYAVLLSIVSSFYVSGYRENRRALLDDATLYLTEATKRLDITLEEITEIGTVLLSDEDVQLMIGGRHEAPSMEWFTTYNAALKLMRTYTVGRAGTIIGAGLFTEDGRTCVTGTLVGRPQFSRDVGTDDRAARDGLHALTQYPYVLRYAQPGGKRAAALAIQLSRDFWSYVFDPGASDDYALGVYDAAGELVYLRPGSGHGTGVHAPDIALQAVQGEQAETADYLLLRAHDEYAQLSLGLAVPKAILRQPLAALALQSFALLLVLLVATALVTGVITRSITRSIRILQRNAELIGAGRYEEIEPLTSQDELNELGLSMTQMARHIQTLIADINQREVLKRKLEVQVLRAQISPHFLYNSLNTISYLAALQGAENITRVSASLITLLQSALQISDELIPLDDEIANVHSYFALMQYRFVHPLRLEIDIREDVQDAMVMRMVLQPIVENALIHGIGVNSVDGLVRIACWREGETLILRVTDNGAGMSAAQIEDALNAPQNADPQRFSGIGLRNVVDRIHLRFSEAYGLEIQSQHQVYTAVTLRIPYTPAKELCAEEETV